MSAKDYKTLRTLAIYGVNRLLYLCCKQRKEGNKESGKKEIYTCVGHYKHIYIYIYIYIYTQFLYVHSPTTPSSHTDQPAC
jgi:hypothetical protein